MVKCFLFCYLVFSFSYLKKIGCNYCEPGSMVLCVSQFSFVVEHSMENVQEKLQGILVQEVHLAEKRTHCTKILHNLI